MRSLFQDHVDHLQGGRMGTSFFVAGVLSFRIWRGSNAAPDPRRYGLYGAAISVGAFIVYSLVLSPTSGPERDAFAWGVKKTCFPSQRASAVNANFTDEQLREYCSCISITLSKRITKKEVRHLQVNKSMPASANAKAIEAAEECKRKIFAQ